MSEVEGTDAAPAKVDPEALVLRGRPRRVVRFRRGVIIAAAAMGSSALIALSWVALEPAGLGSAIAGDERGNPEPPGTPEALADAPSSYAEVPKLGPPLPGDLGRPILDRQRSLEVERPAEAERDLETIAAERERAATARRAALASALLVEGSAGHAIASDVGPAEAATGAAAGAPSTTEPAEAPADPNMQRHKQHFLAGRDDGADVNPHAVMPPAAPAMLSAGSVIAASLLTGLDSDLPGTVTAQVTQNIYDSVTGKILLIPQGVRLIGRYDSVVAFGQRRALVAWQRILFPDGASVRIDNWPASDTAGYAGLEDKLDLHTWQLLKGIGLSTLLGVGTETGFGDDRDLVRAIRESAQQNGSRAGDQLVAKNLDIQPTIKVRPGWPLRLIVQKDLVLPAWRQGGAG